MADSAPGRVSRRLHVLLQQRVVHIDVEIAPATLGYHARANLWLRVHPSEVKNVGRSPAREPEIAFAAAISGPYNIHAVAHCRDLDELFEFTSEHIGLCPACRAWKSHLSYGMSSKPARYCPAIASSCLRLKRDVSRPVASRRLTTSWSSATRHVQLTFIRQSL
ncbi:hypothetical protein GCM10010211_84110 [Streptomyces albospinus]|uniref:Transcription regulator AsnC/Lrp ligand binding domain-containing protein n=1 Tax=Streptomyces albospinus TaxID=285515 RepID=A0ABQ2VP20_9ACTN|nr:hypothetical protein GCM10010211_84110 [Streptomyces albospinus]